MQHCGNYWDQKLSSWLFTTHGRWNWQALLRARNLVLMNVPLHTKSQTFLALILAVSIPPIMAQLQHLKYYPHTVINSVDIVPYVSCLTWPPIAEPWIHRKRPCSWPSKVTIRAIVSKGCRIVHKPHELSTNKEFEFRFSFSEAELILFEH